MSNLTSPTSVPGSVAAGTQQNYSSGAGNIFDQIAGGGSSPSSAGAGSQNTSNQQEAPPAAATSPYEYQQYVAPAQVQLGPEIAALLGLPANQAVTGDQILHAYYDMSHADLVTLQSMLYQGGFYVSTAGTPLPGRPVFGSYNIDGFDALSQAILAAANGGTDLSSLISQGAASGAAIKQQQGSLSPISGGGNTYQINLTNPQDIYQTAYQVFEQELGRAPTKQELSALTASLQSQETSYQQGEINQQEGMSKAKYQQAINSRTAMITPAVANGQVSNGPFQSPAQAALAILQAGGFTASATNVSLVSSWIEANGGLDSKSFNPLDVKTGQSNGGQTSFSSWSQGIQAAVDMLHSPQYSYIAAALQSQDATQYSGNKEFTQELSQWSGGKVTNLQPSLTDRQNAQDAVNSAQNTNAAAATPPGYNPGPDSGAQTARTTPDTASPSAAPSASPTTSYGLPGDSRVDTGTSTDTGPQTVSPAQENPNQGLTSPGDSYLAPSTLTQTQAPSPGAAAFTAATTGANRVPFLWNQYLNAYQAVVQMIKGGGIS